MSLSESFVSLFESEWAVRGTLILVGLLIILVITGLLRKAAKKYIKANDHRYRSKKAINLFAYLLFVIVLLFVFSDKLGGITMAIGLAGAGIAFALQEVIASIAGWLTILFGSGFKTGDRVQFGGIKGDVIDVGVLKSTIMEIGQWVDGELYNGRIVTVANSFVFKEPVFNYSADFPFLWDEVKLNIKHGSDLNLARQLMDETGKEITGDYVKQARENWKNMVTKYYIEDAQIDPMVTLTANENHVEFTLRYIVDAKKRRGTKDKLFTSLLDKINNTKGKVQLTTTTLQLVEPDPVTVSLKS